SEALRFRAEELLIERQRIQPLRLEERPGAIVPAGRLRAQLVDSFRVVLLSAREPLDPLRERAELALHPGPGGGEAGEPAAGFIGEASGLGGAARALERLFERAGRIAGQTGARGSERGLRRARRVGAGRRERFGRSGAGVRPAQRIEGLAGLEEAEAELAPDRRLRPERAAMVRGRGAEAEGHRLGGRGDGLEPAGALAQFGSRPDLARRAGEAF